ncbi:helix-turn-helix domain-containing protein [Ensifer aridi]|uniref:helix-turn-helix domain-containing protein n=1 Tax=Ensifer aridi TaxID=1708715 RepID=UPI001FCCE29F|nr:helix-turn-helix domain-containing protein [Ensifer aridi]
MTAGDVALLATELEISQATAYRLIKLFRTGGTVMSLVDRKRGRPEGHRALDDRREEIIRTTINRYYLTRNRPAVSQLIRDVQTNCMSVGLKPPHRRTIKARLEDIDLQKRAKRRGENDIMSRPGPFLGCLPPPGLCRSYRSIIRKRISLSSTRKPGSRSADPG